MIENKRDLLLSRLKAIGVSLAQSDRALALIGLGSVGMELDRLDEYSDLDFFVIVETGFKNEFINDLGWLSSVKPIAYAFRNTQDGYKLLFQDRVFCEFAVFEEPELLNIPFSPGRIIWKRTNIPDEIRIPHQSTLPAENRSVEWLIGEALTNLYIGLNRHHRGEKLSAMRFIQVYAVDRVLELTEQTEDRAAAARDIFSPERRVEQRHPQFAQYLPEFVLGYERSRESAKAILSFLESHFEVDSTMKQAILDLCNS